jgi:prepilin-type N-terminal cleavage/methylation domain-containing protein/prepilin-type processing-associated H-X9-DG protein
MQQVLHQCRRAFSLIELLVVIAVLSLLSAILLPVFAAAREKARQAQCVSNQRQLAAAFLLYAQDYDDSLPPYGDRFPRPSVFWNDLLRPYLRSERVLECPSWPQAGKYANGKDRFVAGRYGVGVNYGALFRYTVYAGASRPTTSLASLPKPSQTMLAMDSQGSRHVYTPLFWTMTLDWDHDGVPDTNTGVLSDEGPYNRGDPFRHGGGLNCAFADGHARWIDAQSWLTNREGIWGNRPF